MHTHIWIHIHTRTASKAAHDSEVKAKLKAADKLATKLAAAKLAKKRFGPPKEDPGKIGSKSAVKAIKSALDSAHGHSAKGGSS